MLDQRSNVTFRTFQNLPLEDAQEMPLMPAFTAGLSVFALLTMFHYVSVAHISPTVTFGFAFGGCFDFKMVIPYILAQIVGAVCGAALAMVNNNSFIIINSNFRPVPVMVPLLALSHYPL